MISEELPEVQKQNKYTLCAVAAVLVFFVPLIVGYFTSPLAGANPLADLEALSDLLKNLSPLAIFAVIFFNNAIKALLSLVLGVLAGLPTLFFLGFNGYILGSVVSALQPEMSGAVIAASLIPHGVIEIAMVLLASTYGLAVGLESLRHLFRKESAVKATLKKGLKVYVRWVIAGLFIAAVVEVLVTPVIVLLVSGGDLPLP
jgi:stage II sporulation protein M